MEVSPVLEVGWPVGWEAAADDLSQDVIKKSLLQTLTSKASDEGSGSWNPGSFSITSTKSRGPAKKGASKHTKAKKNEDDAAYDVCRVTLIGYAPLFFRDNEVTAPSLAPLLMD